MGLGEAVKDKKVVEQAVGDVEKISGGGRNNSGKITTRHVGGGHKQKYRVIDFKRNKHDVPGKVERLEYDPNRSAHIMLVAFKFKRRNKRS